MKHFWVLFFLSLIGNQPLFSQRHTALHKYRNMPYAGDSIIKQQMEYAGPGAAGKQITWNFSSLRPVNDSYNLLYKAAPDDTIRISLSIRGRR